MVGKMVCEKCGAINFIRIGEFTTNVPELKNFSYLKNSVLILLIILMWIGMEYGLGEKAIGWVMIFLLSFMLISSEIYGFIPTRVGTYFKNTQPRQFRYARLFFMVFIGVFFAVAQGWITNA